MWSHIKPTAIGLVVLLASQASAQSSGKPENREVFVSNGHIRSVYEIGSRWLHDNGALVGNGEGNFLYSGKDLGPGNFRITARLSIDELNDSAASFVVLGSHFGFDADQPGKHRFFVNGHHFGRTRFLPGTITAGKPFDFEAVRRGSTLTVAIDGKQVWQTRFDRDLAGPFALRPWRATMRVHDFAASGNLIEKPNLPVINPMLPRGYTIPVVDISQDKHRQVVVDREPGQYLGHPTTVLLADGRTMFCTYPLGHGGPSALLKKSTDGGLTWSDRLAVPENWRTARNCPCLHRLTDPAGIERLFVLEGNGPMRQAVSTDGGTTWTPFQPNGLHCTVAPNTAIRISAGRYLILYAREYGSGKNIRIWQSITADGGLTWQPERIVAHVYGAAPDEPGTIRSPDGKQILALMRENQRRCNSLFMVSKDDGQTWSVPAELPAALTGDRHMPRYAPDGRLVVSFRDMAHESPTYGDWIAWVGTYDDVLHGREGQYRIRLMDNLSGRTAADITDCGYPGLEVLPDGTFVATTYGHWIQGEKAFIMSVRFNVQELDTLAEAARSKHSDQRR